MDSLLDRRDLPIFIHSTIDDMTDVTPNAMRVYMHLARRADKGGRAWPSYQSIGDHCFSSISDNAATRKSFARKCIDELIAAGLLLKEERTRDDGGQTSNGYVLTNPTRGSTHVPISTPMPIDTPMSISTPVPIKHPPVPNEHAPCLSGTEDIPIEETPVEETEKEETHARDPLTVAWQQAYADVEMPPKLTTSLQGLAKECGMAATIHGIKASASNPNGRNFKYIAECARNYVPPANLAGYVSGPSYQVDIPGVRVLEPVANGHESPAPLPPPMEHNDPWAVALAELSGVLPGSAPYWLEGSRLVEAGELAGEPLYRVLLTNPRANAQWLMQQAEPAIRKKLAGILRKRILLEFVNAPQELTA